MCLEMSDRKRSARPLQLRTSLGRSVEVVVDASKPLLDDRRKVEDSSRRWFGGEVS